MGLDMNFYLRKTVLGTHTKNKDWLKRYVEAMPDIQKVDYPTELECFRGKIDNDFDHVITEYAVGYIRKFYPLHEFIVNCFADEQDNCQYIQIPFSDLDSIISILTKSLDNASNEEIEEEIDDKYSGVVSRDDFNDGSDLSFDHYAKEYPKDVEYIIELFTKIRGLSETLAENSMGATEWEFYYRASW